MTTTTSMTAEATKEDAAHQANRVFYDRLWSRAPLLSARKFNTWAALEPLYEQAGTALEIGPGLHPRLALDKTRQVDVSKVAVDAINNAGGQAVVGSAQSLPFGDETFDLACAFDVIEHVTDDHAVLSEITRCLKPGGHFVWSVPLHPESWTEFDTLVGHCHKYRPDELGDMMQRHGLSLVASAPFGLKPKNNRLVSIGMKFYQKTHRFSMWWHTWVFHPLSLKFQKPLAFKPELGDLSSSAGVILHTRKD